MNEIRVCPVSRLRVVYVNPDTDRSLIPPILLQVVNVPVRTCEQFANNYNWCNLIFYWPQQIANFQAAPSCYAKNRSDNGFRSTFLPFAAFFPEGVDVTGQRWSYFLSRKTWTVKLHGPFCRNHVVQNPPYWMAKGCKHIENKRIPSLKHIVVKHNAIPSPSLWQGLGPHAYLWLLAMVLNMVTKSEQK